MEDNNLYQLDGRVPLLRAIPFGLQHVLAMFVSNITPIIILAGAAGLGSELSAILIQNCMIIAGIGTLVQLYPVWKIGSRLPIVMGISFTFLSLAIAIATTQGMGTLVGAVIIGGLVEGMLGLFPGKWTNLIPPVVAATVVTAIGFSLLPIGANSFAGGVGAADAVGADAGRGRYPAGAARPAVHVERAAADRGGGHPRGAANGHHRVFQRVRPVLCQLLRFRLHGGLELLQ